MLSDPREFTRRLGRALRHLAAVPFIIAVVAIFAPGWLGIDEFSTWCLVIFVSAFISLVVFLGGVVVQMLG